MKNFSHMDDIELNLCLICCYNLCSLEESIEETFWFLGLLRGRSLGGSRLVWLSWLSRSPSSIEGLTTLSYTKSILPGGSVVVLVVGVGLAIEDDCRVVGLKVG